MDNFFLKKQDHLAVEPGISQQAIKSFTEDAVINYQCTFNPLDKVMELYERLLQAEREKNELLKGNK